MKLNLGCGSSKLQGWTNVDSDPGNHPDSLCDLRQPLPWPAHSVDFIYMEHFFEHLTAEEQERLLWECYRILKPNGVLRISGPDLHKIAALYLSGDLELWRSRSNAPPFRTICDMMNNVFYGWGHRHIPDWQYLALSLLRAGFKLPGVACDYGQSVYPELCNLETRSASRNEDVIVEALK